MDVRKEFQSKLVQLYEAKRAKNPAYSLRTLARILDLQPSSLSELMRGKRGVSKRLALKTLPFFKLSTTEEQAFRQALESMPAPNGKFSRLDFEDFNLISKWHYFAIVSVCCLNDFEGTEAALAKRLHVDLETIESAVKTLIKMKILDKYAGKIRTTNQAITVGANLSNEAVRFSHGEHLSLAQKALEDIAIEFRDFSFINIALDLEMLTEAKVRIRKFRRHLNDYLENAKTKNHVYRLGIQLFPLTQLGDQS